MVFLEESISASYEESKPLLKKHWEELEYDEVIKPDPDINLYLQREKEGTTRTYVVRADGKIIGYAFYLISYHPHYKTILIAKNDLYFISPEYRGLLIGKLFLEYCECKLKESGVKMVVHHVKVKLDWSKMLERMGYVKEDIVLIKRLD